MDVGELYRKKVHVFQKEVQGQYCKKKDYTNFFNFNWDDFNDELKAKYPALLSIVNSMVSNVPITVPGKPFLHVLMTSAIGLHGRNQEMSMVQFMTGFLLTHGGCTQRNIERLSHLGLSVHPVTIHRKLAEWQKFLDKTILSIKEEWEKGGHQKYQLIGDNWDKNILPSYRTSDRKTLSVHLFNIYAIVDRVQPVPLVREEFVHQDLPVIDFLPSIEDQTKLRKELNFIISTSIVNCHPHMQKMFHNILPKHLEHRYTEYAGVKTRQFPFGLYDCNENKTPELIKLMKELSQQYVPCANGEIVEPVFFGGDRLTDERMQSAQNAMANGHTAMERLEGFISKIEDFHRLMNFLQAIHKMTYSTESVADKCTVYYYRNLLNMRNVKGKVCNSYRAYKMLYYAILDAIIMNMFLRHLNLEDIDQEIKIPFATMNKEEKLSWLYDVSNSIVEEWFFCGQSDIFIKCKDVVGDPEHPDNYWVSTLEDGRVKCHFCEKTYAYTGSLRSHEAKCHNVKIGMSKKTKKEKKKMNCRIIL